VAPSTCLDAVAKRKIPSPFRKSNPDRPARKVVAIPTDLSRIIIEIRYYDIAGLKDPVPPNNYTEIFGSYSTITLAKS
jgi:hypothetical protein